MTSTTDGRARITLAELRTGRVGLVLMGGGAKGAYQVGVWRALWERGVRRFSVIAGTSVGALNGLLIADADPSRVEQIWRDVVAGGVLISAATRRRVLLRVLSGYLLFFLPVLMAFAVFMSLSERGDSIVLPVIAVLVGGCVWLHANYLRFRVATMPLLVVDVLKIREIGIIAAQHFDRLPQIVRV